MKVSALIFTLLVACGSKLAQPSAASGKSIADHADMLEKCRSEGREAGSYAVYEGCKDGGPHD